MLRKKEKHIYFTFLEPTLSSKKNSKNSSWMTEWAYTTTLLYLTRIVNLSHIHLFKMVRDDNGTSHILKKP